MKVGLLTSSRADYGIYLPLIRAIKEDVFFQLEIIVFGTHLSEKHGMTFGQIIKDGFDIAHRIETISNGDSPLSISRSIGNTIYGFSELWDKTDYDLILALGDRYEMFAACASSVPFNIPIAHIHGGEITLGAIDDSFRNSITQMSNCHFVTTEQYKQRVIELKGNDKHVYNVGALSIDNLNSLKFYSIDEMKDFYNIDFSAPTILITFHPETVEYSKNKEHINEIIDALNNVFEYQLIITMPNADTNGDLIRNELLAFADNNSEVKLVESFGTLGYLSSMKYATMLLGNSSSGFVEAAFFSKYVINLGNRQKGRIVTPNIRNVKINKTEILDAIYDFKNYNSINYDGIYGDGDAASKIISILKNHS